MTIFNNLRAMTALELLNKPFAPWEHVLEPWLRTEETAVVWAASGVGKTWLNLSIALAVAGGGSVGTWTAPKARKVLLIDGEMNLRDLKERIASLLDRGAVVVPDRDLALGNLEIIARQHQDAGRGFLDLTNEEHQRDIIERVKKGRVDLVIFDNLTTLSEGLEDENDAAQFKPLQGLFMALKTTKVAAILVHHANKGSRQMRGSTALETTFEVIIGLTKPTAYTTDRGASFDLAFGKFRGQRDERTEPRTWTLDPEGGWVLSEAEPDEAKSLEAVRLLKTGKFTSQAEIAKEMGVAASTVTRQFQRAKDERVLTKESMDAWFAVAQEAKADKDGDDLTF